MFESEESEMELKFRRNPDYQDLREEITPEKFYIDRRALIAAGGTIGAGSILGALPACSEPQGSVSTPANAANFPAVGAKLTATKSAYAVADAITVEDAFTQFCNFYEFEIGRAHV